MAVSTIKVGADVKNTVVMPYDTSANTKVVIELNGTSSLGGILTFYDGTTGNLKLMAVHAYSANGTSLAESKCIDVGANTTWSGMSVSGAQMIFTLGSYRSGLLAISHTAGHRPTISYTT